MGEQDDGLLSTSLKCRGNAVTYGPSREPRAEPRPGLPVLVLGVHGRLGHTLIEQALQHEHTVTTLSRRPLELRHPRLRVVKGDVLDTDALETAMRGQQAVLAALGDTGDVTDASRLLDACANVAHAMRRYGVHRIGWFVPVTRREQAHRLQNTLLFPPPRPGREQPTRATAPLEWVVVQAHALTDAPSPTLYEVATGHASLERPIARVDVAGFMLAQLEQPHYAGSSVLLAGAEPQPEGP